MKELDNLVTVLVEEFKNKINSILVSKSIIAEAVTVYNNYQHHERFDVDYLFNLTDQVSLSEAVTAGLTAKQIYDMIEYSEKFPNLITSYYFYGENHRDNIRLLKSNELIDQLTGHAEEIIKTLIKYPRVSEILYNELIMSKIKFEDNE